MRLPVIPEPGRISDEDKARLGELFATGALYKPITFEGVWMEQDEIESLLPVEIKRPCESSKCNGLAPNWKLDNISQRFASGACGTAIYRCRNCGGPFYVWFYWHFKFAGASLKRLANNSLYSTGDREPLEATFTFKKTGQYPALSLDVPRDLADALGDHIDLYRKGLVCWSQGFGLGAHAYFRRVLEETMTNMLTYLAAALRDEGADPAIIERVEAAKNERVFERKIQIAADVLPERLRPEGFNPFNSLFSLHSSAVHEMSEQECLDEVEEMRSETEMVLKSLKTHVEERKGYKEAARRFQQRTASRRPRS